MMMIASPDVKPAALAITAPAYDLFVIHADADQWFVQGYLLPELGLPPDRVLVSGSLRLGQPLISELERGVWSSRVTIVVLSFAYMADHWAVFGEQIAAHASMAREVHGALIPLQLEDCPLPPHISALERLDFRNAHRHAWTVEIGRLRKHLERPTAPDADLPCPYLGMRVFTERDADRFFGRDAELDDIVRRLRRGEREIYIIGASGSGKSSLIAAGLVPRLTRGQATLGRFLVRSLRPGERPLDRLTEQLQADIADPSVVDQVFARYPPAESLLLVIDQLEELFAIASADQRHGFLSAIRRLRGHARCVLVFTLRADFYGSFMESPLWSDLDGRISRIELGALREDDLRMVIERPARDIGVYFQPQLVSQLLADAAREPGALPLLQETLVQLWISRRRRLLALADYLALGEDGRTGLAFAVSEHADAVLRKLSSRQEPIALRILVRLVSFGEGRADTRRQQRLDVLRSDGDDPADFDVVFQRLVNHRLVTVTRPPEGDVQVDIAHEVLIHAWRTFADWIQTWRHHEQRRREIEAAATAWRARGSREGGLLDNFELASASVWRSKAAERLGISPSMATFLAASKAAHARAIRSRRLRIGIAVAALAALVSRIVIERNRADEAARVAERQRAVAEQQRAEAERRAEELTLAQARYNVDTNPTKAVAMLRPLAAKYWREVRAIGAAARAAGVAWSLPAAKQTRSLEMSHDGKRAVSAGEDGVVRIHDLVRRTTQPLVELHTPVMARFADGDRQVVVWHDDQLAVLDPATGKRTELTAPSTIRDLEVVGTTAYWVDERHALWRRDLAGGSPQPIALEEPVTSLSPSPDGHWIALAGESYLYLLDRTHPSAPASKIPLGVIHELSWSADGLFLAALVDDSAIAIQTAPVPQIVDRQMVGPRMSVAHHGGRLYIMGPTGVAIVVRSDQAGDSVRKPIRGAPVGITEARGDAMIAAASDGITILSEDGDRVLPLAAARIERVVASPRSPYLLAQLEGRLLLWNLDDIQPRRLSDQPTGPALFADADHVIAEATRNIRAQQIDLATAAAQPLGLWQELRAVSSAGLGRTVAIIDRERHVHLAAPGREPTDLPGAPIEVDIAGFATDNLLVLATPDGQVLVHDVARGQRTPLLQAHGHLLGLAWGRGHHPWVAAAFSDGTLWRKNLVTSVTATIARAPALDPARLAARDGRLLVAADGGVVFLHDREVHTWRADGSLARLAQAPKLLEDLGEAGPDHVLAVAGDTTLYTLSRTRQGQAREALASIEGSSVAMSPDTGLLVAIEHGALQILDPLVHQRWTLAVPEAVAFDTPAISADGRHVVANTPDSLLVWSIELPTGADATARWLDAMTNAVDDPSPGGLGWR